MKKLQSIISDVADRVDSVVQRHLPELQQHLPQHLFEALKFSDDDAATLQRRVPRSLDLCYVTSQLIVMSAPAEGLHATRVDCGRGDQKKRNESTDTVGSSKPRNVVPHRNDNEQECDNAQVVIAPSKLRVNPLNEVSMSFDEDENDPVDMMLALGDQLITTLQESDENDEATLTPPPTLPQHTPMDTPCHETLSTIEIPYEAPCMLQQAIPQLEVTNNNHVPKTDYSQLKGNNPSTLSTFFHRHHANKFLAVNLTNTKANDRTLVLLRRQVVNFHWASPRRDKSETPTLSHILDVVYMMQAYMQLDSTKNTIILYCQNGKTRSAIVLACYLKFIGAVQTCQAGFEYFLIRRCPSIAKAAVSQLPPSLHQLFSSFDAAVDRMDYANRKPLLLRAIALQGVPVEDQPCLDVYCQDEHIYSSSPDSCQWADEEGLYRIAKKIEGDFMIIVRFGGEYSSDRHDASKVLFRYCHTTGFCTSGPLELPKSKVDMMRRYADSFDEGDFLLTLLWDSYWDSHGKNMEDFEHESTVLVEILNGDAAVERGLHLLTARHAATAGFDDVVRLRKTFVVLQDCPIHCCSLALQLNNHDLEKSMLLLTKGKIRDWWMQPETEMEVCEDWPFEQEIRRSITPELTCHDILKILDDDEDDTYESQLATPSSPRKRTRPVAETPLVYDTIYFPSRGDIESFLPFRTDHINECLRDSAIIKPRLPFKRRATNSVEAPKKARTELREGYNSDYESSMELILQINHTGVSLEDLLELQRSARTIGSPSVWTSDTADEETVDEVDEMDNYENVVDESGRDLDDSTREGAPNENARVMGLAIDDPEKIKLKNEEKKDEESEDNPPLKRDPLYLKYFKMVSMGMSVEVAKHAMQRDSLDPSIMDLDPERSLKDQQAPIDKGADDELPLNEDPEFMKYFKMLKMGMPVEVAKHAMKRDGKDESILDLNPNKSLKSQLKEPNSENAEAEIALENDPEYAKYFKMMKMGLPSDAVKHSMQRDGKDPSILDLDPKKSLASQMNTDSVDDGPPLMDDPEYEKYFKMLKMGLPLGAVKNGLVRDGKDPAIMDLDPNKSLKSQLSAEKEDDGPPLKEDEEYSKYFKMLKMGLPVGAVKNAITRDGKDPSVIDLDPEKSLKSQQVSVGDEPPMKDTGTPLRDDPEYSKYFKMMKMGLPPGAVKNAISRDGKDPSVLDLNPDQSLAFQLAQNKSVRGGGGGVRVVAKKKKKKVRRKKIYWTPIDASKIHDESLWSLVKGSVTMETLKFDETEFENLFTESANPVEKKNSAINGGEDGKAKQKKSTQVIDGKRGMNGGIILARLKIKYDRIAEMVDAMEAGEFDSTQLKALKEFLPTDEDRTNLKAYLKPGEASEQAMAQAMADLSECEKYMVAMMKVENPVSKFDAMFFKFNFNGRMVELEQGIVTVKKACDEVKNSERLRKLMAMILTLVNHINTGGDGNLAAGFSLDALLKLNEAKAFDKKTSVLEYLVKLVRENDMSLLDFNLDIETVPVAQNIVLDGLLSDVKVLNDELQLVCETAKCEANRLEEEGKLNDISLSNLREQRTELRAIDGVAHFNKVEHKSGRTPMERFTLLAQNDVNASLAALDDLKDNYSNVLKYFGEDDKMPSNDFFGTLHKFSLEFKVSAEKVDVAERQRAKEKLQAAAKKSGAVSKLGTIAKALISEKCNPDQKGPNVGGVAALAAARAKSKLELNENADKGIPLKDDPSFAKYFKMLKMGLSLDAVKHTLNRDGKDPSVLDLDPDKSLEYQKISKKSDESGVANLGTIGAMAAAASAMKATINASTTEKDLPIGGIAALATAANSSPTPGGIAAMAAAAAVARNQQSPNENEPPEKGTHSVQRRVSSSNAEGISAMASTAAIKLVNGDKGFPGQAVHAAGDSPISHRLGELVLGQKSTNSNTGISSGAPPSTGGIAAMAAAAAAKRNLAQTPQEMRPKTEGQMHPPEMSQGSHPFAGGGIAAMAAAAAAKRNYVSEKSQTKNGLTREGISSNRDLASVASPLTDSPVDGGMAVTTKGDAALHRNGPSDVSAIRSPFAGGGIAAAATAAAAKRTRESKASPLSNPFGGGGIAAAAAAAAAKRNIATELSPARNPAASSIDSQVKDQFAGEGITAPGTRNICQIGSPVTNPFAGGGIAAAAAAAAAKRNSTLVASTDQ